MLCHTRKHAWTDFLAVVKREDVVGVSISRKRAMRARLTLDLPTKYAGAPAGEREREPTANDSRRSG